MTASGLTPGGVEALGRFRRHAGSGALGHGRSEADHKRGRVRSLDTREVGEIVNSPLKRDVSLVAAEVTRRISVENRGWAVPRFRLISKEVVGLGTGAAAPVMAHAILEACGWCYGCLAL